MTMTIAIDVTIIILGLTCKGQQMSTEVANSRFNDYAYYIELQTMVHRNGILTLNVCILRGSTITLSAAREWLASGSRVAHEWLTVVHGNTMITTHAGLQTMV